MNSHRQSGRTPAPAANAPVPQPTNQKIPTPWGTSDRVTVIAPGIKFVSTPSHGGFYLAPERNAAVPIALRMATFGKKGMAGWYEEDCDAHLVPALFPQHFPPAEVTRAEAALLSGVKGGFGPGRAYWELNKHREPV